MNVRFVVALKTSARDKQAHLAETVNPERIY